ncbi:MAG: hypothetical protein QHH12_04225 [Candidatus Bathyarchaeota archaeon]|nr:hypothetical protein [Candidatus Bathyarchaeota archaeon A05DMB-3]MDH7606958.1 hypothetical protein [Candidatus Bathyarchaeota archaeon]
MAKTLEGEGARENKAENNAIFQTLPKTIERLSILQSANNKIDFWQGKNKAYGIAYVRLGGRRAKCRELALQSFRFTMEGRRSG